MKPSPIATAITILILSAVSVQAKEKPNARSSIAHDRGSSNLDSFGGRIEAPNLGRLAQNQRQFNRSDNSDRRRPSSCDDTSDHSELSKKFHPAVTAFFDSDDPFIKQTVIPNIEKHRKANFVLSFETPDGKPVEGLNVAIDLYRHRFRFGCSPPPSLPSKGPHQQGWLDLWEYGVFENVGKWSQIERTEGIRDFRKLDALIDYMHKNDLAIEYHFLTGYHPGWFADKSDEEKVRLQRAHALNVMDRYHDRLAYVQVYNEIWRTYLSTAVVFLDTKTFFEELVQRYPDVEFGTSDCWQLNEILPSPAEVKQRYPGIRFLAVHGHMPRRLWASPQQIYECFESYKNSDIKIHVSEFGVREGKIDGTVRTGTWNEGLKATYFVQVVATFFSHPAVRAFNHWGMGPGQLFLDGNRLVNDDYSKLPAYDALRSLIKDKFSTHVRENTGKNGDIRFNGFLGRYALTVENADGPKTTARFDLSRETTTVRYTFDADTGQLRLKPQAVK